MKAVTCKKDATCVIVNLGHVQGFVTLPCKVLVCMLMLPCVAGCYVLIAGCVSAVCTSYHL